MIFYWGVTKEGKEVLESFILYKKDEKTIEAELLREHTPSYKHSLLAVLWFILMNSYVLSKPLFVTTTTWKFVLYSIDVFVFGLLYEWSYIKKNYHLHTKIINCVIFYGGGNINEFLFREVLEVCNEKKKRKSAQRNMSMCVFSSNRP